MPSAPTPLPPSAPPSGRMPDALDIMLALRERSQNTFRSFVRYWSLATNQGPCFLWNWHIDYLCDVLQSVTNRDPATRFLIINMPPRFAKSTITCVLWPAWMIGVNDHKTSAVFSMASSAALATRDSRATMDLLREPWYKNLFPHVRLQKETEAEWTTAGGAYRIAVGAEGTVTGRGATRLLVDDLLQADEADSPLIRSKRNEWLGRTLRSRLDDPRNGTITLIQQRLHEQDSTGYLLEQMNAPGADQYTVIKMPLEAKERTVVTFQGTVYATREVGDLLHPARIGPVELAAIKAAQGHNYEAQYQQDPTHREGGFFAASDLHWVDDNAYPKPHGDPSTGAPALSWMLGADYATSAKTTSDHTAIVVAGVDQSGEVWIHPDSVLERLEPLAAVRKTIGLAKRFKTYTLGHEKGVIANTLKPLFDQEMQAQKHFLTTEHYARTGGKHVHAAAIKGLMQSGRVHLPRSRKAEWEPLLLRFRPEVDNDHDDLIDALATIGILLQKGTRRPKASTAAQATPYVPPAVARSNFVRQALARRADARRSGAGATGAGTGRDW